MHTIRLRGPWQKVLLGDAQPTRVTIPETGPGSSPGASYKRKFNCPTGIENATVYLAIDGWRGRLNALALNDKQLPITVAPLKIDVTNHLQSQNTLTIHLSSDDEPSTLSGEVSLRIDETNSVSDAASQ